MATEKNYSFLELAKFMIEEEGRKSRIVRREKKGADENEYFRDIKHMKETFGWSPHYDLHTADDTFKRRCPAVKDPDLNWLAILADTRKQLSCLKITC